MPEQQSDQTSPLTPAIHIQQVDGTRHTFLVEYDVVSVGKSNEDNSIVIRDDLTVADHHAEILFEQDQVLVVDLGSISGTYMADSQLIAFEPMVWPINQPLRIGTHILWWNEEHQDLNSDATPELTTEESFGSSTHAEYPRSESPTRENPVLENPVTLRPIERQHWFITPGSQIPAKYVVTNQSAQADRFTITTEGIPPDWMVAISPPIELMPNESGELILNLQPPKASYVAPGAHIIETRAIGQTQGLQSKSVRGVVEIQPFSDFYTQISNQSSSEQSSSGQSAIGEESQPEEIHVTLENRGNSLEQYIIDWHSDSNQLTFDPPQTMLELPPGAKGSRSAKATVLKQAQLANNQSYLYSVTIRDQTGKKETLSSQFFRMGASPSVKTPSQSFFSRTRSRFGGCLPAISWSLLLLLLPCLVCVVMPLFYFNGFELGGVDIGGAVSRLSEGSAQLWNRLTGQLESAPATGDMPTAIATSVVVDTPTLTRVPTITPNVVDTPTSTRVPTITPNAVGNQENSANSTEQNLQGNPILTETPSPQSLVAESSDDSPQAPLATTSWLQRMLGMPRLLLPQIFGSDVAVANGQTDESVALAVAATQNASAYATAEAESTQEAQFAATATIIWRNQDDDNDGLVNGDEEIYNTLVSKSDTDQDGLSDLDEVRRGTNPRLADSDNDGLLDLEELQQGRDPRVPEPSSGASPVTSTSTSSSTSFSSNSSSPNRNNQSRNKQPRHGKDTYVKDIWCRVHTGYDHLMLREGPGRDYDVIIRLSHGTPLYPIAYRPWPQTGHHWVFVDVPGPQSCQGWVSSEWINCFKKPKKYSYKQ
ncbi:MAG: FHA domain-containing protein [Chloroflexota bacterium]